MTVGDAGNGSARGVVARYFRMWNDGEFSVVSDLIAPGWVDHAHPERRSVTDVQNALTFARAEQPGTRVLVDAMLGDGNLITVNGRIETSGATQNWVWIVRLDEDRIQEIWTYYAE